MHAGTEDEDDDDDWIDITEVTTKAFRGPSPVASDGWTRRDDVWILVTVAHERRLVDVMTRISSPFPPDYLPSPAVRRRRDGG